MITIDDKKYDLIENFREAFNEDEFKEYFTEYFYKYDYIVGDYAYNKLRLKGFYDDDRKEAKELNKIKNKDKYINENCAYQCKFFVLKKI